jgi:hypothetical protein
MTEAIEPPPAYRLLTGADDRAFCERVAEALHSGYVLHGSPAITTSNGEVVVAQALIYVGESS